MAGAGEFQGCFAVEILESGFDVKSLIGIVRTGIALVVKVFGNLDFDAAKLIEDLFEAVEVEGDLVVNRRAGDVSNCFFEVINAGLS